MSEFSSESSGSNKSFAESLIERLNRVKLAEASNKIPFDELLQMIKILDEQEDHYHQLIENLQEVLWIGSPDWQRVWYVNRAYEQLWDQSRQSLYDRPMSWLDSVVEEDRQRVLADVQEKVASGVSRPGFMEYRIARRDGSIRWIMARAFPIYDEYDRIYRVAGLAADITSLKLAEEGFRSSESRVQALVNHAPVGILLADPQGRCHVVNQRWCDVAGLSPQEASGRGWMRVLHRAERRNFFRKWREAARTGYEFHLDLHFRSPAGKESWQAASIVTLRDETGKTTGYLGTFTDITQRRIVEERLKQSEIDYRTLAENLTGIVYRVFIREENRMRLFNTVLEPLTGFRPEELTVGNVCSIEPLILEEDRKRVVHTVKSAVLTREPFEVTYRLRCRNGDIRHFSERGRPIYDEEGMPLYIDGVIFDITEQRQQVEALRASEQRLSMAQRVGRLGVFDWDIGTGKVIWNEQMERIFGLKPGEFEGDFESWRIRVHPEDWEQLENILNQSLAEQRDRVEFEYRLVRPDGEVRWVTSIGEVTYRNDGTPLRMIGTDVDITERKESEALLRRAGELLEQRVQERTAALNRTVADLRAEVELRMRTEEQLRATNLELERRAEQLSQLTTELTLAEQRERHRLGQVLHDHLQQLLVGAKFGLNALIHGTDKDHDQSIRQVEELLDESIKASRSLTVELCPPILSEAGLNSGLKWLARWMQEKHGLIVTLNLDPAAIPDREDVKILLFQAVRELLLNVVKHAHILRSCVETAQYDDTHFKVVVSDDGMGFDPGITEQLSNQTAGGFGLYSIRERLNLLRGRLEVDSSPGKGARFTLIAPFHKMQSAPPESAGKIASYPEVQSASARFRGPGEKIRLLLADDHAVVRKGLSRILSDYGKIEVVGEASDGEAAVEQARQLRPDVILMDLRMPKLNGVEATRIIRAELPTIRIIGLSTFKERDHAIKMIEAGALAYLTKGCDPEALITAIESCMQHS